MGSGWGLAVTRVWRTCASPHLRSGRGVSSLESVGPESFGRWLPNPKKKKKYAVGGGEETNIANFRHVCAVSMQSHRKCGGGGWVGRGWVMGG